MYQREKRCKRTSIFVEWSNCVVTLNPRTVEGEREMGRGERREERGERKVETDMGYDTGKKGKDDHRSHFGLFAF